MTSRTQNPKSYQPRAAASVLALAFLAAFAAGAPNAAAQTVMNSSWLGDGSHNFSNGNWSNSSLWNPANVPGTNPMFSWDVTIQWDPNGEVFNGPQVDVNVNVRNLTLVNRVFLDNQAFAGTNLTVTGSTTLATSAGHDGETAAVFWKQGTILFGTLTNYNAATHTLNDAFFFPIDGATFGFHGADVVVNKGTLIFSGPTSRIIDQDTNQSAIRNLAVNEGGLTISDGNNFTTAGNFTNNSGISVSTGNGLTSVMTITGSLTNFSAANHTLSGGSYDVEVTNMPGTATLRFPNADIRTLDNATIKLVGAGATIQDLAGQNALRNLQGIQGSALTNSGTLTITPSGGTFTNDNSTHVIDQNADVTIDGNHHSMNGGVTYISAPGDNSNSTLHITGSSLIEGGGLDFGGQPSVNTQYHTTLQVINGIEFRGAFLTGTGTTFADAALTSTALMSPGHSPGQLDFVGSLTLGPDTTTLIEIGGRSAGMEYDVVNQTGPKSVTLGGNLAMSFVAGFQDLVNDADEFVILTSEHPLLGSFANVASGERLYTFDNVGSFIVDYAGKQNVTLSGFVPVLALTSAVSRHTHTGQGTFDVPLPLTGAPGVECRGTGNHTLVLTFSSNLVSGDVSISAPGGGSIAGSPTTSGKTMTVNLTGVTNAQVVTVTLDNVVDEIDQVLPSTQLMVGFLNGDSNGDGTVNSGDAIQTRNRSGQPMSASIFRSDANLDGSINSGDAIVVRNRSGSSILPPAARPSR